MELSDIPIYVYPILFVVFVILIAVLGLFLGKRKYNQENGIVKEKKVKEPKPPKAGKKLKRADDAAAAASYTDEFDSEDDYDNAVEALKSEQGGRSKAESEPEFVAASKPKVQEEEIIEWKPPAEEKKTVAAAAAPAASSAAGTDSVAEELRDGEITAAVAAAPIAAAVQEEPREGDWNDEDLELFEARAYSFDEETQSGYISDKPTAAKEEKQAEAPVENMSAFRERKEPSRNPSEDEGVQVFETKGEPKTVTLKQPTKEEKANNTKYAYFDSVMEKEKSAAPAETEWKPPQERAASAPSDAAPSNTAASKKKSGMQYIELDLDDKKQ